MGVGGVGGSGVMAGFSKLLLKSCNEAELQKEYRCDLSVAAELAVSTEKTT